MKAKNLRLNQSYRFIEVEYCEEVQTECEHCTTPIKNLYTITGSDDNKKYIVGSECVNTLTLMNPDDFKESKRIHTNHLRGVRILKNNIGFIWYEPNGYFRGYKTRKGYEWSSIGGALIRGYITPDLIKILKTKEYILAI